MNSKLNDIHFSTDDWEFSYRVGGLLYRNGKLLLQHNRGEEEYSVPGGHSSFGEFTEETLAREWMEETGAAVNVGRLCAVVELFWQWVKPCHQLNFFYLLELKNPEALPGGSFPLLDDLGQPRGNLEFSWVSLEQLDRIKVYPTCLQPYLKQLPDQILHLQQNELEES